MRIQSSSCLMPNHLPGKLQSTYDRVEMLPTPSGRVIILGINKQKALTVWLSGHEGLSAWEKILFKIGDGTIPAVLSLDFKQSADMSTVDMVMVANVDRGSGIVREVYYWDDINLTGDSEYWTLLLSRAVPMKVTVPGSFIGVSLSQRKTTPRSFVLYGTDNNTIPIAYWVEFDQGGREVNFLRLALPCPAMPAEKKTFTIICGQLLLGSVLTEVYYLGVAHPPTGLGVYVSALPGYDAYQRNLFAPQPYQTGMLDDYGMQTIKESNGETTLWLGVNVGQGGANGLLCFFTPDNVRTGVEGNYANKTLEDYIKGPKGMFKILRTADGKMLAYELGLPQGSPRKDPMYLLQTSAPQSLIDSVSTLISSDVTAFTACECTDPDSKMTVRHLLLCHPVGGMELLELDPVSEMWQSTMLLDGDLKAVTETQSFTTRIVIKDDTYAPYCNTMVTIKPDYPMLAFVDGKAIHLSSVITHAISTNMSGEVTLVTIADTLATPTFTVEAYDMPEGEKIFMGFHPVEVLGDAAPGASLFIDPTAPAVEKLKAVKNGMDIKNAKGSNGQFVFPQGTDDRTYDQLFSGLQKYLEAYDSTQVLERSGKRWQATQRSAVVERTLFSLKAGRLHVQQQDTPAVVQFGEHRLETFAGVGDGSFLSLLSDILSYIWTEITDTVEVILDKLSDGFYRIAVWVGKKLISAVFELGIQVLVMIDWLFETVLKTAFEVMVNWLGYVFDWEEIRKIKVVFKQVYKISYQSIYELLGKTKTGITATADMIRNIIDAPPVFDPKARAIMDKKTGSGDPHLEKETELSSPSAQWGVSKMKSYFKETEITEGGIDPEGLIKALEEIFSEEYTELTSVFDNIKNYIESTDLKAKSLLEVFEDILRIIATAAVDVLEILALKLVELAGVIFEMIWELISTRIEIPVLTSLYEKYIEPGGTFTMIDCMSFISSCAYTIGYKAITGNDPFTETQLQRIAAAQNIKELEAAFSGSSLSGGQQTTFIFDAVIRIGSATCQAVECVATAYTEYLFIVQPPALQHRMAKASMVSASTMCLAYLPIMGRAATILGDSKNPDYEKLNIVIIAMQGLRLLSVTIFATNQNAPIIIPVYIRKGLLVAEIILGGVIICLTAADIAVAASANPGPTPPDTWNWLVAGPSVQNFLGAGFELTNVLFWYMGGGPTPTIISLFILRTGLNALRPVMGAAVGVSYIYFAVEKVDYPLPTLIGY